MIKEHDRVVLTVSPPATELVAGDVGTVVGIYKDGAAFEVEFVALDGHTTAVATVDKDQVRPVTARDMTHILGGGILANSAPCSLNDFPLVFGCVSLRFTHPTVVNSSPPPSACFRNFATWRQCPDSAGSGPLH